jgi:hypothetical protein
MSDGNHCMTAIQIEILLSFVVPYVGAFGFYDGDVIDRINVK